MSEAPTTTPPEGSPSKPAGVVLSRRVLWLLPPGAAVIAMLMGLRPSVALDGASADWSLPIVLAWQLTCLALVPTALTRDWTSLAWTAITGVLLLAVAGVASLASISAQSSAAGYLVSTAVMLTLVRGPRLTSLYRRLVGSLILLAVLGLPVMGYLSQEFGSGTPGFWRWGPLWSASTSPAGTDLWVPWLAWAAFLGVMGLVGVLLANRSRKAAGAAA